MPTIYKPAKKVYKRKTVSKRGNENHAAVYNTVTWKKLRIEYLKQHPICEICEAKGKVSNIADVHHKTPISTANTKHGKQILGFDWSNLQSLCTACHKEQHLKTTF